MTTSPDHETTRRPDGVLVGPFDLQAWLIAWCLEASIRRLDGVFARPLHHDGTVAMESPDGRVLEVVDVNGYGEDHLRGVLSALEAAWGVAQMAWDLRDRDVLAVMSERVAAMAA